MEISSSEIGVLSKRINESISGYSLGGIYSIEGGMLLRLRHESKQELLVAISSFAPWITTKNITVTQEGHFMAGIRELIERARLTKVSQASGERITEFAFESRSREKKWLLYAEFFAGGNLILVDGEGRTIVEAERHQKFRHRVIAPGAEYSLPPSRGINLFDVSEDSLRSLLAKESSDQASLNLIRWFGRNVATSRKFVEEIFARSNVDLDLPLSKVTDLELKSLGRAAQDLSSQLESSRTGYLLLPVESLYEDEEAVEVDVCSFVPVAWKKLVDTRRGIVREYQTLSEALDEAQVQSLLLGKKKRASKEVRAKAAELEAAISKQTSLIEKNSSTAKELRSLAANLMSSPEESFDNALPSLVAWGIVEKEEGGRYRFASEPRSFVSSISTSRALASRLFDEAKRLQDQNRTISGVREDLQKKRETLVAQTSAFEDRAVKRTELERRPKEWFERYRWFFTSDLRLSVGGKDSTSNSVIINKYAHDTGDYVFHADLHGSPFFVIKNKSLSGNHLGLPPEVEQELAQATVSFSRAWKDELGSADAFWVMPDQVKKSAPSGEYLPRGSFFIDGRKNFVKHVRVELAVGLMTSEKLAFGSVSSQSGVSGNNVAKLPVVVCGPEKSLSGYCDALVKIAPGKERGSAVAKKIKQRIISRVREEKLKEMVKKLPYDEFIRVLPSGTYKVIAEKQNG